ncbi:MULTISPECIES: hypothetical protein [Paracoccus]|uniref:Uncharacterized protein n=1 Tax=Paracoccus versutus TaxID=34007 RepID=A0A3D9XQR5_PARVE|nr:MULTISPECIES: hypothetical protein [Paracoccus]REF72787.1 hypothetical protein BDD41_1280 [Paracoccus versutus]WGR55281.1 hypothetical protein E3U25_04500 [Paracoccus versutus]
MPRNREEFADVMGWFETRQAQMEADFPVPPANIDWHGEFIRISGLSGAVRVVGGTIALFGCEDGSDECRLTPAEIAGGSGMSVRATRRALRVLLDSGWVEQRPSREDGQPVYVLALPSFAATPAGAMLGQMDRRAALTIGTALTELTRASADNLPADAVLTGGLVAVASAIAADHGPDEAARCLRDLAALIQHGPEAWPELPPSDASDGFEAEGEAAFRAGFDPAAGPSGG